MKIFNEKRLQSLFETVEEKITIYVKDLPESAVLKDNTDEFLKNAYAQFEINTKFELSPEISSTQIKMQTVNDDDEKLPFSYFVERNNTYNYATVHYTFKFTGNSELLKYQPTQPTSISTYEGKLTSSNLSVIIWTRHPNKELSEEVENDVKKQLLAALDFITDNKLKLQNEIDTFNYTIEDKLFNTLSQRKKLLQDRIDRENRLNPFS